MGQSLFSAESEDGLQEPATLAVVALLSALLGLLLVVLGMAPGQRLRRGLPERSFRPLFFLALLALGSCIRVRSLA